MSTGAGASGKPNEAMTGGGSATTPTVRPAITSETNVRRVYQIVGSGDDRHKVLVCREIDTNFDGVKDVVRRYNEKGDSISEDLTFCLRAAQAGSHEAFAFLPVFQGQRMAQFMNQQLGAETFLNMIEDIELLGFEVVEGRCLFLQKIEGCLLQLEIRRGKAEHLQDKLFCVHLVRVHFGLHLAFEVALEFC